MEFTEALRAHGLVPRKQVVADGCWHRCATEAHPRKRNGSYKLATDGRVGWFQDFARDCEPITWRPEGQTRAEPYDPSWIRAAQLEAMERVRVATLEAREFYGACKPLVGGHPYLESHGLDMRGTYGLRVDAKGWLVVPAHRERLVSTVQRISGDGDKRFWPGASVKGAAYLIGRSDAPLKVVCEGLATGLAIYAAIPQSLVVVAFNAGNLTKITIGDGLAVVAADNDWETVCQKHRVEGLATPFTPWSDRPEWCLCNPGRNAAEKASGALQCGVAFPEGIAGTDWSDWRVEKRQQRMDKRGAKERVGDIERAVDADLAMRIGKEAVFAVRTKQKTGVVA